MTPDEILDQIDHALQDWDVSPDAMRWTPEAPEPGEQPPSRGAVPAVFYYDEAYVLTVDLVDQIRGRSMDFGTSHVIVQGPGLVRFAVPRLALSRGDQHFHVAQPTDAPGEGAR